MNLVELYDIVIQAQSLNGVPLSNGHVYVYALGRTRLMDTWSDVAGESLNTNPVILDNAGQAKIYVSDAFDYTLVFTDEYDNEIFSVDKYLLSQGAHSHADVAVAPSESIAVSSYNVGEVTVYVPYLTGQLGKVYEGIEPIVVNNELDKISANHVALGVQDPLYFVQDDEEGCIIGFSGQPVPEGVMTESALGFENDKITGYNGSAFSAGNEYEAGSYVDITDNTISVTGLQPEGDYAYNSALSSKLDVTATGQFLTGLPEDLMYSGDMTAYQPAGDYQTAGNYQTAGDYLSASDSANFLLTSDSGNFYPMEGNPSGFLTAHQSLDDYATKQWVEDKGYITGIDIQESGSWNEATTVVNNNSAIWNNTTNVVSSNSAQWGASNPQIPVTGINGIKISESGDKVVFEVSGDYYTNDNPSGFITGVDLSDYATTAQLAEKQDSLSYGYHDTAVSSIDSSAIYDTSAHARINTLAGRISDLSSNKLDTTAFSDVSGTFLTAHQDLSDYQTTAGMTAYQPVGNYQTAGDYLTTADSANFYTTANESGFITGVDLTPYQLTADMTAYQPTGDYLTTADSANFYTTANESGFITGVPAGTMNESSFGYNGSDRITGYNGSAFAQGGGTDLDFGYDESGAISSINTSALSDSRAGTPLYVESPLFTGQSGDSAYIGSDINETIIWTGTGTHYPDKITTNEPLSAFERFKVIGYIPYGNNIRFCIENDYTENSELCLSTNQMGDSILRIFNTSGKILADGLQLYSAVQNAIWNNTTGDTATVGKWFDTTRSHYIQKVIGINRKRV